MKGRLFVAVVSLMLPRVMLAEQCKWGLEWGNAGGKPSFSCSEIEALAAHRLVNAKRICYSDDSYVSWPKTSHKPDTRASFENIHAAMSVAARGYVLVRSCKVADLVAKFEVDDRTDEVSLTVTDGDSNESVFHESRSIQNEANDLYRVAKHFQEACKEARTADWAKKDSYQK
jgi:hypothetical protein